MNQDHEYFKNLKKQMHGSKAEFILGVLKTFGVFLLLFLVSFIIINFPAYLTKTKYFFKSQNQLTQVLNQKVISNNHLYIPKMNIDTPITWNVPADNVFPALENGVAHYEGTALPGQIGNTFIYGHSSYYWWNKGSYKEIFAILDKLNQGDKIYVSHESKVYTYIVTGKKVVSPNDLSVLNQTNTKTLSLMTCTPVGTTLNRLVVTAQLLN
ncbi:MAG: sortase [Candidatus Berkelbacteria bacterium]